MGAADAWAGEDQQRQLAELARPAPAPTRRTRPHALPPADQRSAFLATVMTAQLEALPPAAAQTLLAAGNRLEPAAAEPADLASAMSLPPPCDLPGPDDSSDALARLIRGL